MNPGARRHGERSRVFGYFCEYRDFGPGRTVRKVWEKRGRTPSLIMLEQHCARYGWVQRAPAFDDYQDRLKCETEERAKVQAIEAMVVRHDRVLGRAENSLIQRLVGDEVNGIRPLDPNSLDFVDTIELLLRVQNQQRIAAGLPTTSQQRIAATVLSAEVNAEGAALAMEGEGVREAAYELLRRSAARKTDGQGALPSAEIVSTDAADAVSIGG